MSKYDKMPDYYQVKISLKSNPKTVRFAQFSKYSTEAEKQWDKGFLLFDEALTGEQFLVPSKSSDVVIEEQPLSYDKVDPETRNPIGTEYDRYLNDAYKKAKKLDKKAGKGIKVNKLVSVGVADGYAIYVITKVNAKTCKIAWRAFGSGDRYVDHRWGYGKTISKDEASMYVRSHDLFV